MRGDSDNYYFIWFLVIRMGVVYRNEWVFVARNRVLTAVLGISP